MLLDLNRRFYAQFAADFARTRRSWPPGFDRILPHLRQAANVVDLGCGNGRLLAFLAARGWRGDYCGVDSSPALLAVAARLASATGPATPGPGVSVRFLQAELATPDVEAPLDWPEELARGAWDVVASLAVLHHIPGAVHRVKLLAACARLLRPGGLLLLSTWQFLSVPRLCARILPWESVGLHPEEMEPGDYLLPWGENAAGVRYCAAIDAAAVRDLGAAAGLALLETFRSDGQGGALSLYARLAPAASASR